MYRVTVLKKGRFFADGMRDLDPNSYASVQAAAEAICSAKNKTLPGPATVRIEEKTGGGRWRKVNEVVVGG